MSGVQVFRLVIVNIFCCEPALKMSLWYLFYPLIYILIMKISSCEQVFSLLFQTTLLCNCREQKLVYSILYYTICLLLQTNFPLFMLFIYQVYIRKIAILGYVLNSFWWLGVIMYSFINFQSKFVCCIGMLSVLSIWIW